MKEFYFKDNLRNVTVDKNLTKLTLEFDGM